MRILVISIFAFVQDDAEYYDPPGGLLSLDLHLGPLVEQASHLDVDSTEDSIKVETFVPHFNLVNAQLSQVRKLVFNGQRNRADFVLLLY